MVFTSYAGCTGSFAVIALPLPGENCIVPAERIAQNNGSFHDVSPITLAAISDGLSNTLFLAEKSTTTLRELDVLDPSIYARHGWYITGNWGDTLFTTFYPPNAFRKLGIGAMDGRIDSASSLHPGGVNALMGDGSVRFLKETIQSWPYEPSNGQPTGARRNAGGWWENVPPTGVWQALSTRGGGEIISTDAS